MNQQIETLLLLALPASGKSEVRKYLSNLSETQCREEFHMGPTVQLDDFPYVHFMRRIAEEMERSGLDPLFFRSQDTPFSDPLEWGTLIELLNEDYEDMLSRKVSSPPSVARHLFERLERARIKVGGEAKLSRLDEAVLARLAQALEPEAAKMIQDKHAEYPDTLKGKTIVLEFARGGADQSSMPLPPPFGYQYSLSLLSDKILSHSAVLYIWVTPEESRRKNDARADPNDPGSILHHGVPLEVMMKDYGCDDMEYLLSQSNRPDTIKVQAHGKSYHLPVAFFDNRVDKTTFIREDPAVWQVEDVKSIHQSLAEAFNKLSQRLT